MPDLIGHLALSWWSWMAPVFWQASLLIVVISAADVVLRRFAWPQVRYALWTLVLLKLLLPPTWSASTGVLTRLRPWVESQVVEGVVGRTQAQGVSSPLATGSSAQAVEGGETAGSEGTHVGAAFAVAPSLMVLAASVWLSGMLLMTALLWVRIATLRRWHRTQEEHGAIPPWFHQLMVAIADRLGLDRLPAIVFSDKAVAPAVYGLLRPTLLLPASYLDALERDEAEHVLLHELAHIKRGDLWFNAAWLVVQTVYWFNPLVAWARREVKHVREMCCDMTVAGVLRERTPAYRSTLLNTARKLLTESLEPGLGLLGVFEEPYRLVPRLRMLERNSWRHRRVAVVVAAATLVLLTPVLLPMAAARPGPEIGSHASLAGGRRDPGDSANTVASDHVFVLEKVHSDDMVLGIPILSKAVMVNTTWLGDGVAAATEGKRTVVVDRHLNRFLFINHRDRTYVEAPLDTAPETLLDSRLTERVASERSNGSVVDTGSTDRILGRRCREFEVSIWRVWGDDAGRPVVARVWATPDVAVDLGAFDEMLEILRRLYNRDERLRRELRKIRGVQVRYERVLGRRGLFARRIVAEAVEIARRSAPAGTFDPPAGYHRVDRIAVLDP